MKPARGVPNIIDSCRIAHDPEPEFISDQVEFKVLFKFPTSLKPSIPFRKEEYPEYLSERQREILKILTDTPKGLKAKEIVEKLKTAPASRTLRDDLAILKKSGIVESWGRGKNAIWFVSYKKEPEVL